MGTAMQGTSQCRHETELLSTTFGVGVDAIAQAQATIRKALAGVTG
jgi:hypothetical protein